MISRIYLFFFVFINVNELSIHKDHVFIESMLWSAKRYPRKQTGTLHNIVSETYTHCYDHRIY